ncbi:MAG: hypothetical protein ACLQNU_08735, partial [Candidatus Dormibacteria bacterium]
MSWRVVVAAALVVAMVLALGIAQLARPLAAPTARASLSRSYTVGGTAEELPWPAQGQAALYLPQFGWLGSTPDQDA